MSSGFIHYSGQNYVCVNVGSWKPIPCPEKENMPRLLYRIGISQWDFKSKVRPRASHPGRDEEKEV